MLENGIFNFLKDNLDDDYFIYWGKINRDECDAALGDLIISFFKTPSQSALITPSYLDSFQISIFSNYIDIATRVAGEIIQLFHCQNNVVLDGRNIWVNNIIDNGTLYEQDGDVVQEILNLELKYTGKWS